MTPPLAPRRVSWAIAGRLVRAGAAAFMLVLLVALVAWPERHAPCRQCEVIRSLLSLGYLSSSDGTPTSRPCNHCQRDASLSLLPDVLGM